MLEASRRELEKKAITRHYGTILFRRLNGESVEKIAESLKMERASVSRCLAWAEKNWSQIILPNGDGRMKPSVPEVPTLNSVGEASCVKCSDTIEAGEYRIVVLIAEVKDGHAGRISRLPYCDTCVAQMSHFEILNTYKMRSDEAAIPSAGPATEDAAFRSVSVQGIAERVSKRKDGDGPGDGETMNEADIEANILSTDAPDRPLPELAGEAAQRARLASFLKAPSSRGMRSDMRTAARLWVEGASQSEVARKLGKDQSTVSRMIAGARKMAYARG